MTCISASISLKPFFAMTSPPLKLLCPDGAVGKMLDIVAEPVLHGQDHPRMNVDPLDLAPPVPEAGDGIVDGRDAEKLATVEPARHVVEVVPKEYPAFADLRQIGIDVGEHVLVNVTAVKKDAVERAIREPRRSLGRGPAERHDDAFKIEDLQIGEKDPVHQPGPR